MRDGGETGRRTVTGKGEEGEKKEREGRMYRKGPGRRDEREADINMEGKI